MAASLRLPRSSCSPYGSRKCSRRSQRSLGCSRETVSKESQNLPPLRIRRSSPRADNEAKQYGGSRCHVKTQRVCEGRGLTLSGTEEPNSASLQRHHTHTHMCLCAYICMYIYTYTYIHAPTYINMYVYMYIHIKPNVEPDLWNSTILSLRSGLFVFFYNRKKSFSFNSNLNHHSDLQSYKIIIIIIIEAFPNFLKTIILYFCELLNLKINYFNKNLRTAKLGEILSE